MHEQKENVLLILEPQILTFDVNHNVALLIGEIGWILDRQICHKVFAHHLLDQFHKDLYYKQSNSNVKNFFNDVFLLNAQQC